MLALGRRRRRRARAGPRSWPARRCPTPTGPGATVEARRQLRPHARGRRRRSTTGCRSAAWRASPRSTPTARGDIYFVTISNPTQSALSWWVGRRAQLRRRHASAAPSRRSTSTPTTSCTRPAAADPGAQHLAADDAHVEPGRPVRRPASASAYDATINPGNVVVADLVCLEAAADGTCTTQAPAADGARARRHVAAHRRRGAEHRRRPRRRCSPASSPATPCSSTSTATRRGERTVEVELTRRREDPTRTIVGFLPFDTATRRPAVRDRHRHRAHRRAVGRRWRSR